MKTEEQLINQLASFGAIQEANIDSFDELISESSSFQSAAMIKQLLFSLDDYCEFDEVMFGIVHTVERMPRARYFEVLGGNLPVLISKAPRWTSILHTRIMNAEAAFEAYLGMFSRLDAKSRNALLDLLTALSEKGRFQKSSHKGIAFLEAL